MGFMEVIESLTTGSCSRGRRFRDMNLASTGWATGRSRWIIVVP